MEQLRRRPIQRKLAENSSGGAMTATGYTWDNAMVEGRRRLALLEHALDPATLRRMERIGVGDGWSVLELGAGGGSVTAWLCQRVGSRGRVCAVDIDARFVQTLDFDNLDVYEGDILSSSLPANTYQMIHARWTLMHIAKRDAVMAQLMSLLKPGGVLFLEEPDCLPVDALDRTGFRSLCEKIFPIIRERGSEPYWARDLPTLVRDLGVENVQAESEFQWYRGRSELAEFWKMSWSRVRDGVAARGVDVDEWDRELSELDDPSKLFVQPMTIGVWGTKPTG
jgi:SAM-dependent methyltransferase